MTKAYFKDANRDPKGSYTWTKGGSVSSSAGTLAIPITHSLVKKTTGSAAEALTLADGEPGQMIQLQLTAQGSTAGAGTLTPATLSGFSTVVFSDVGDVADFLFVDYTVGWTIVGAAGTAAPPVIS